VKGEILDRLDCLPSELQGHGWQPFVAPADYEVTRRMAQALQMGRAGTYDVRAQSRIGDPILYIRVRTLVLLSGSDRPGIYGALDLLHSESRRTIQRLI
jgi:hypothetical protein